MLEHMVFSIASGTMERCSGEAERFTVPEGVRALGPRAFFHKRKLRRLGRAEDGSPLAPDDRGEV